MLVIHFSPAILKTSNQGNFSNVSELIEHRYNGFSKLSFLPARKFVKEKTTLTLDLQNNDILDTTLVQTLAPLSSFIEKSEIIGVQTKEIAVVSSRIKESLLVLDSIIAKRSPLALLELLGIDSSNDIMSKIQLFLDKDERDAALAKLAVFFKVKDEDPRNLASVVDDAKVYFMGSKEQLYLRDKGYPLLAQLLSGKLGEKSNPMLKAMGFPGITSFRQLNFNVATKETNSRPKKRQRTKNINNRFKRRA